MTTETRRIASLTHLIPLAELAPGQAGAIRNSIINKLVMDASKALNLGPDKLVVRDCRADTDLDYGFEDWGEVTGTTTAAYETMSTGTMGDQRWWGIFGVKIDDESLSVSSLRFSVGGGYRAIWHLQHLNSENGYVGLSPSGIVVPQNVIYTIERWVLQASMPAHVVLKGVIVEPRGRVISP